MDNRKEADCCQMATQLVAQGMGGAPSPCYPCYPAAYEERPRNNIELPWGALDKKGQRNYLCNSAAQKERARTRTWSSHGLLRKLGKEGSRATADSPKPGLSLKE